MISRFRYLAVLLTVLGFSLAASNANGQGKEGARAAEGDRRGGDRRGGAARGQDQMAQMAMRMIREFDRNGDRALNAQELQRALTALRQMMARQRGGDGQAGAGGRDGRGGADRRRRDTGGRDGEGGGERDRKAKPSRS